MTSTVPLLDVADLQIDARTAAGVFPAVRKISFSLERSSSLALVGESGSGKSLSALAIAGLLAPNLTPSGSVTFEGMELLGMTAEQRRRLAGDRIGFIFQEPMSALHPVLTVGQQLSEGLRAHTTLTKAQRRDRVLELLELVGLNKARNLLDNRIGQLSGGMRQRVMIAMAISCEPDLLIADEPTTALDVTLQKQIIDLLVSLRERMGLSLLLITHDLGVVADTCEEAVVMYAGQVVERGAISTVLDAPRHVYTRALMEAVPVLGDTRRRLPSISSSAPWLKDTRALPRDQWPHTELELVGAHHWVRNDSEEDTQ